MSLLFCDGFDNYSVITDFWDSPGSDCSIRLNTGQARTGIGCLQINSGALGPVKSIRHVNDLLLATNWFSSIDGSAISCLNSDANSGFNATVILLLVLGDGNIRVVRDPQFLNQNLGQTATPGLVQFNQYVSIAARIFCDPTFGAVKVWVNGLLVLNLSGLNTTHAGTPVLTYYNQVQLLGPGGIPLCFHDDPYFLDCSTPPHQDFLGALRMYSLPPTANAGVVWTPNAGTNWSNVNEVPPDGDTSYNSASNVGDTDQYVYPATGIPAGASILFVQHDLDIKVDSGSRSVGSVINGTTVEGAVGLTSDYHIYPTPYDVNPSTGIEFALADFPVNAGPKVTA